MSTGKGRTLRTSVIRSKFTWSLDEVQGGLDVKWGPIRDPCLILFEASERLMGAGLAIEDFEDWSSVRQHENEEDRK